MKKNNDLRKRDHLTSTRNLEKALKAEGFAEDLIPSENALTRQPVKATTLSPQRGHCGNQAHLQDHRQSNGIRSFRNLRERGRQRQKQRRQRRFQR